MLASGKLNHVPGVYLTFSLSIMYPFKKDTVFSFIPDWNYSLMVRVSRWRVSQPAVMRSCWWGICASCVKSWLRPPALAAAHRPSVCVFFWCDHIFWFVRDLILRPSRDPAWRRMESQLCLWVLAVLGSQRCQREVVSGSDNHWYSLTVLHLSEANEKDKDGVHFSQSWIYSKL